MPDCVNFLLPASSILEESRCHSAKRSYTANIVLTVGNKGWAETGNHSAAGEAGEIVISGRLFGLIARIFGAISFLLGLALAALFSINLLHHHYGFYGINLLILVPLLAGLILSLVVLFTLGPYKQSLRSSFVGQKGIVKHVFKSGQVRIVVEGYAYIAVPQEPVSRGDTVEIVAVESSMHYDLSVRKV